MWDFDGRISRSEAVPAELFGICGGMLKYRPPRSVSSCLRGTSRIRDTGLKLQHTIHGRVSCKGYCVDGGSRGYFEAS